jgi:hypothetical protein
MTRTLTAIAVAGALAFAGAASAAPPEKKEHKAPPTQAKAYGKYCQDQSKKKAEGQTKSDFATCVNAMAKADKDETTTAREACAAMSKKHVKGEKGTPFSRCRVGVAQMRKDDSGA